MQLFYAPDIEVPVYTLPESESKHIIRVLRKTAGDEIHLVNGKGTRFMASLIDAHPKRCVIEVKDTTVEPPIQPEIHLAVAPTKNNDRMEWLLEKATEIGLASFTPVICDRSERKTVKQERLEKTAVAAMKQSLKSWLPVVHPCISLADFVSSPQNGQRCIAHCEPDGRKLLKEVYQPGEPITVLIGPEGDFTPAEIERAINAGYQPISLGDSRLRTETAALAALHTAHVMSL